MNEFKQIRTILTRKIQELTRLKLKAEHSLKKAPEGSLVVSSSNGVTQYFCKTSNEEKKGRYIKKDEQRLIRGLAQKDYDERFLRKVNKQIDQIKKVIKNLPEDEPKDIINSLSETRKNLVIPHVLSDDEYVKQWLAVDYTGKNYASELPMHTTDRGEKVRSKSEKMIADKLNSMGIAYRYEYPLTLKSFGTVYPDFTMLDVSARKEIYHEHFGMMDDPEYCEKAILKIQEYEKNGIFLGKNLLVTFESRNIPLDMRVFEAMVRSIMGK